MVKGGFMKCKPTCRKIGEEVEQMKEWIGNVAGIISANPVLDHIWGLCLSASAMILFLLLIRPFMKRLPRIAMYLLWILVVIRMVCPFSVNGVYGLFPQYVGKTVAQTRQSVMPGEISAKMMWTMTEQSTGGIQNSYRLKPENSSAEDQSDKKQEAGGPKEVTAQSPREDHVAGEEQSQPQAFGIVIMAVWIIGVLFCALYLTCSLIMNRKVFRHAVHLFDNVYEHPYACSSFVGGIIFPKIYVPKGMSEADLECLLIHERGHIRRQDYRIKPLAFCVFSLLWFNPIVWVAYRLMMRDMEISCDEMVMRSLGNNARKRYSYLLLAMASGENGILCPNTAFGAGAVNERIHNVMRYKKPTRAVTVAAVLAVIVCGCGISSAPEETADPMPFKEEKTVYIEQTLPDIHLDWSEYGVSSEEGVAYTASALDEQGNLVQFGSLEETDKYKHICEIKVICSEGEWKKEEVKWEEKVLRKKNNAAVGDVFYGADGFLYVEVVEHSIPEEEFEGNEEDYYEKNRFLYRVNEKTSECTELVVPVTPIKEAMKTDKKGVLPNGYAVLADGSYVVCDYLKVFSVYSGVTGEKTADIPFGNKSYMGPVLAGDDFVCWYEWNQKTERMEVHVCEETGQDNYVLETEVEYDGGGGYPRIQLGTKGDTILMATDKGIFEAAYGEDHFRHVAGQETDNLYYLSPDGYCPVSSIYKGQKEDYYLYLMNDNTGDFVWCHYTRKEE